MRGFAVSTPLFGKPFPLTKPLQVDFRSQPNTLGGQAVPAASRTPPRPHPGPGGAVFPVEGTVEMCFDGSGGHAPPSARHLFPDSAGRSVSLFRFAFRLGQRGIAPLCARPLDESRRQVELGQRHILHAVGVKQRRRIVPEHRPEGARGRREAERVLASI